MYILFYSSTSVLKVYSINNFLIISIETLFSFVLKNVFSYPKFSLFFNLYTFWRKFTNPWTAAIVLKGEVMISPTFLTGERGKTISIAFCFNSSGIIISGFVMTFVLPVRAILPLFTMKSLMRRVRPSLMSLNWLLSVMDASIAPVESWSWAFYLAPHLSFEILPYVQLWSPFLLFFQYMVEDALLLLIH